MTEKKVYLFSEGNASMKNILGGKGAGLAEMVSIGLPVPPGFTISTGACNEYQQEHKISQDLIGQTERALATLEASTGKTFGYGDNPLLVSVRSGAAVSMPGMMDTILNLGLNDETVEVIAKATDNERFALDCYRRFIQMFGEVVMKAPYSDFEHALDVLKKRANVSFDNELTGKNLRELVETFKTIVRDSAQAEFPQDTKKQLYMAIEAVFDSWQNPRAKIYRQINKIPDDIGTAVTVQSMVFGNMGSDSGTGVAFTRNPSTGEKLLYGEYLFNAQGEDVVAGVRTPHHISQLELEMPEVFQQFVDICDRLEKHYRNMQDIEFTIEKGKLYLLQTRTGKRTAAAAMKCAVDMAEEGLISKKEAIMRVEPEQLNQVMHRRIDHSIDYDIVARGLPASPGAAVGVIVFDSDDAVEKVKTGAKVILVRTETTPDDIHGILAAEGILTSRGGMTSHAAVVARGMGKPCVCGCDAIKVNLVAREFNVDDKTFREGDLITIDGGTGDVISGEVSLIDPTLGGEFQTILAWADEFRRLKIYANADNPQDAAKAREFAAQGIGLCRTEHMFMAQDRIPLVQAMILAEDDNERELALNKLLPLQMNDFIGIFEAMEGLPVTIRLLDPPLHEFLPNGEDLTVEVRTLKLTGGDPKNIASKENLLRKVKALAEFNPMLGHRGVRLGIVHPDIYQMQIKAIALAVVDLAKRKKSVIPEIMIPLVVHANELQFMREITIETMDEILQENNVNVPYLVGTMIEVPRACVTAEDIAEYADFFSFGTNDLTQTTLGFSRDDAEGKFLHFYVEHKILKDNPFAVIDEDGVGTLVKMGIANGRKNKPNLKIGVCGEHGGDPQSIKFFHKLPLDYISCSPYRVPIARLAAGQAAIVEMD
jgi:pyruvate,orthophosphate dikinase